MKAKKIQKKSATTAPSRALAHVHVADIREIPGFNARGDAWRDSQEFRELVDSVRAHGVLEPILVSYETDGYTLVAGHRRVAAAREAGLTSVPAVIVEEEEDAETLSLIENIVREQLPPSAEARGVARLADGTSQVHTAKALGKSQSWVAKRCAVARAMAEGRVSATEVDGRGVEPIYQDIKPRKPKEEKELPEETEPSPEPSPETETETGPEQGVWLSDDTWEGDLAALRRAISALAKAHPSARVRVIVLE